MNGLNVTGSIDVLIRAKREGADFSVETAIQRMKNKGIRLSERVIRFALNSES